jgi:hypothetical protein
MDQRLGERHDSTLGLAVMARIVVNSSQLGETASLLQSVVGEYQIIGALVFGCDCGCMPADVAATVDAVTADARGVLQVMAVELAAQASGLGWRSGIDQDGGFSAVGGAWGPGAADDGGTVVEIGSGFDVASPGIGEPAIVSIGGGFTPDVGGTYTVNIGGGFTTAGSDEPGSVDIGSGLDTSRYGIDGTHSVAIGSGYTVGDGGYTPGPGSDDGFTPRTFEFGGPGLGGITASPGDVENPFNNPDIQDFIRRETGGGT